MDNKDQRNASVPLGTFNEDGGGVSDASENTDLFVQAADQDGSSEPASSADFARARPGRKRVRTLLGVPLADVREQANAANPRSESISEAIQHMLDEQAAVALEVDERESEPAAVLSEADLDELAEVPRSGVLSVSPHSDDGIPDDAPTKTRIQVPMPSHYVQAQELDRAQLQSADSEIELEPVDDDDRPTRDRLDEEALTGRHAAVSEAAAAAVLTAADGGEAGATTPRAKTLTAADSGDGSGAPARTAAASAAAAAIAARAAAPSASNRDPAPASGRPPTQPVSSLAPRELARRQPAARDAGPGIGLLMVAAMALIAAGGWWLTSGSFSRSRDQANARGAATQAAASQPVAPSGEAMALEAPPSQQAQGQAPQAADALGMQPDSQATDQGSATPNPLKSSKSLTATSRSFRPKTPKAPKLLPTKEGGLPEAPTRADVLQRMESVRPAVRACATGLSGVADLDVTIAHSGKVTHVLVGGDFAGTTQGSCIARAVREAKFPSFKQERFRLLFPYPI